MSRLQFSATALVFLFTLPAWTQSADFINNPQTNDVNIGDVFSVTIQVAPTGTEVSVAEVHLNFDPTLLQVVSLTPAGSPLGNTAVSAAFDNTMGTIEYGAFTLSDFPNTTFDFLTIEFEAVGLTPGTQVTHELAGFPVSLIAFEDVDLLDVANPIDVTITDPNQGVVCEEVLFRVNNGGVQTAAGDASTPDWGEDTQANPSPYVTLGSNNTFTTGTAIDMTHPSLAGTGITQAILQTERWVNTTPPVMQWDFPVTAGSEIQIKLFLAELFVNNPGERIFDVSVEGVVPPAFDNLDPIVLAGAKFKGVMVSHTQTVNDNNLDMDFIHVVQNPAIKAIEVCLVSEPPPPCDFVTTVDPTDPTTCEGNGSVDIQVTGGTGNEVITVLDANENPQNDLNNLPPGDYTYSVVDEGCEETGEFTINPYVDTQAPQISGCPTDIEVAAATGTCSAEATWNPPTATDDCPDPVLLSDFQPGDNFPAGVTIVTYTASDAAGNTSLCTFTVTIVDEEPPSITCPGNQSGTLDADCGFSLPDYTILADVSDDCDTEVSVAQSPAAGTIITGNTTVTLTATDGSGNSNSCSFEVTVSDETPPSIVCPGNQVEFFDENDQFTLPDYTGLADVSDNCDTEVSLAQSPQAGMIITGNTTVTLTATDDAGNSSSCTFQVVGPEECQEVLFRVNNGGVQTAAGDASTPDWGEDTQANPSPYVTLGSNNTFTTGTAIDMTHPSLAGTGITQAILQSERWVNSTPPGMQWNFPVTAGSEIQVKLFFAELFVNNPGERVFDVSVEGVVPPAFDNIDPIALAGAKFKGVMVSHSLTVNDDNLDLDFIRIVQNPAIKAIEVCLVSEPPPPCDFVTTVDPTDPVTCEGNGSVDIQVTGASMDAVITVLDANENPQNDLNNLPPGDYTYSVVDEGCEETGEFTINPYVDTQAPQISGCPSNIEVAAQTGTCSATASWTPPTATDDCPDPVLTGDFQPGDNFPIGVTTVTYTASDAAGNTSLCTFTVTVLDGIPPSITCPLDQTGTLDVNCEFILPDYTVDAVVEDNCDEDVSVTQNPPAGTPVTGNTTVTLTATDDAGNSSSCTFEVTVSDETAPSITCPGDQNEILDENNEFILPDYTVDATVSDNCDEDVSITQSPLAGTPVTENTTVTLTATDDAGNSSSCTFEVILSDEITLSITCPGDQNETLDENCQFILPDYTTHVDVDVVYNGEDDLTLAQNPAAGSIITENTTVTLTVTDESGNSSSCTFEVTVSDVTAPSITCPGEQMVDIDENCEFTVPDYTADATAGDNCDGDVTVTQSPLAGSTAVGNTTVTLTATDDAGNTNSCTIEVTVIDEIPPTITCPEDIDVGNDPGLCGADVFWDEPEYSDNCPGAILSGTNESGDFFAVGKSTVFLTVTDAAGNTTECSFNITVIDIEAPVFENCPAPITVAAGSPVCEAEASWTPPTATDNCPNPSVMSSHEPGDVFSFGITTVTYTAVDAAENSAVCSFTVTVEDQTPPAITCPGDQVGTLDENDEFTLPDYTGLADESDNCDESVVVTQDPAAGTMVTGNTTVTLTATDDAGNSSSCTFEVILSDELILSITCPGDQDEELDEDCELVLPDYTSLATVSYNGDEELIITQSPTAGSLITGNTTVTLTVTDESGNSSTCSFEATVSDGTAPSITCPDDQTADVDANCEFILPDYTAEAVVSDNCDDNVSVTQSPLAGMTATGNTTVTLTATDDAGNSSACSFEVTVSDETAPSITCPGDQSGTLNASCEFILPDYTVIAVVEDNCDEDVSVTQSPPAGTPVTGNTTVTLTATDDAGNSSSCTFEVTVSDETAPSITCPGNQNETLDENNEFILPDYTGNATVSDNCDDEVSVTQNPPAGTTVMDNTTVTLTATDDAGNSSSCSFQLFLSEQLVLSITCPGNQTGSLNSNCAFVLPNYTALATVIYNGDENLTVTQSPAIGATITNNTTVTLTVTDESGNSSSCTFEVTVSDEIPPSITCPADQQEEVDADCEFNLPSYVNLASAIDNCGAGVSVTQSPLSGTIVTGNTTMTLTATDGAGNSSSCTFEVIVSDETPPSITCPGDQMVDVDANCEFSLLDYTADATVSDNCDEDVSVTQSPPAGTTVMGNTIVTLTATDDAGNSSNCTFEVIVSDGTPPSITCPGDQAEIVNADCELVLPDYTGLALTDDNCDSDVSVTQNPLAGATVAGATTVTLIATDDAGNSSSCTFEVTVSDQTPPSIACPANQVEEVDEDCELILGNYTSLASVSDNCDENISVTQSPAAGLTVIGNTMVTLTATDDSGNSSSCSFQVVVTDMTPPSITCPANQTIPLDENCEFILPNYTALVTTSDNCDSNPTVSQVPLAGAAITENQVITLTVTDASGNSANCSFTITVFDAAPPSISCPDNIEVFNAPEQCGTIVIWALPSATDNCSPATVTSSANPGDFFEVGNAVVTYTATDDSGNSASCSFTVSVIDNEPPVLESCPSIIVTTNDPGQCGAIPTWQFPTATDNCSSVFVSGTAAPGDFFPVGFTTVVLSAADASGNTALCSFGVAVLDGEAPQIECQDFTLLIDSDSTALSADDVLSELSDNCEITGISLSQTFFTCDDIGTEIVTVTAVDINGNPASCTATITVEVSEGLPDDWENDDVGSSDPPGFAEFAPCDGEFTVGSTGFNGQLTQDALHIAYQELCGDGVITARVVDISSPTNILGYAGVIMRKDLTIGSPFASLLTRLSTFVYRRVRATQDAAMVNQQLFRPQATWLRLERSGNSITGYTSVNGDDWSFAFAANVNLGECILVGLTAESYTQNVPITATFSDVSITGFNPIPLVAPPAGPPAGNQTIGISLYPNPVDEGLNVMIENAPEGEVELEIIDLNGRQLYRQVVDEALPHIEMNLRPLGIPDGVYILRIRVDDQFFVERFIKRKVN